MFLGSALAPLRNAESCLVEANVDHGLAWLGREELNASLRKGIAEAAARAGVAPGELGRLLPWDEIGMRLERVGAAQNAARVAWRRTAGAAGGPLPPVGDVTVVEQSPGAAFYIERLAAKFVRDKALSGPLDELAVELSKFEALLSASAQLLDAERSLSAAFLRRRLRTVALGAVALAGVTVALVLTVRMVDARKRVDAALAHADPCAVESVEAADWRRATDVQRALGDDRNIRCREDRARARTEAACSLLADHVDAGMLTATDDGILGEDAPFVRRVAAGALERDDLARAERVAVCQGTDAPARIERAWIRAASRSPAAYEGIESLPPRLHVGLGREKLTVPEAALADVHRRAEETGKKAIVQGDAPTLELAARLCKLEKTLGGEAGPSCRGIAALLRTP